MEKYEMKRYLLELNDHQIIDNTTLNTLTQKHAQNVYTFLKVSNMLLINKYFLTAPFNSNYSHPN